MAFTKHDAVGTQSFIGGMPSISSVGFADAERVLQAAVAAVVRTGNESLKLRMQHTAWEPWIDNVSIEWDGSAFVYSLTGTEEELDAMRTLEYGLADAPASPMLRSHVQRLNMYVQDEVSAAIGRILNGG